MDKIYIAGAHSRAQTLRVYLEYLYPETILVSYLVDDMWENASMIAGIPVRLIGEEGLHKEYPVYIGTRGENHPRIMQELEEAGFTGIIPVTVELDRQLRNEYVRRVYRSQGRNFTRMDDLCPGEAQNYTVKSSAIYVAKSVFDHSLKGAYAPASYEKAIQVGAALTQKRLPGDILTDNTGENISHRNRQFCELTALYWIWKNAKEDIVGLVHYRRHFILPEDWVERMLRNKVDVILPVPLYVAPSLAGNYKNRHDLRDWDNMMKCLKERNEREYGEADAFFRQNLYSPCNMAIMRREVLDKLCSWLFPILFSVVEYGGRKKDSYQNRYPGFLSERLITFFFERNREEYNVVYADKNFLA